MSRSSRLRAAADVNRAVGVASFSGAVIEGQWVNVALFLLVLLGLVLPRSLVISPGLDLLYGVVLLFAAWSAVLDWYIAYGWLDLAVHTVACGLTAGIAHRALVEWGVLSEVADQTLRRTGAGLVLTTTALGWALGVLWEIGEWYGHTYLDERIQVGYLDTVGDLMTDGVGAFAAGVVLLSMRRSRGNPALARRPEQ